MEVLSTEACLEITFTFKVYVFGHHSSVYVFYCKQNPTSWLKGCICCTLCWKSRTHLNDVWCLFAVLRCNQNSIPLEGCSLWIVAHLTWAWTVMQMMLHLALTSVFFSASFGCREVLFPYNLHIKGSAWHVGHLHCCHCCHRPSFDSETTVCLSLLGCFHTVNLAEVHMFTLQKHLFSPPAKRRWQLIYQILISTAALI